jgi:hypothetical protein
VHFITQFVVVHTHLFFKNQNLAGMPMVLLMLQEAVQEAECPFEYHQSNQILVISVFISAQRQMVEGLFH